MPGFAFNVSPVYTGIVQKYMQSEGDFISRIVCPPVGVPARTFRWDYYDIEQMLKAPENEVGPYDRPPTLKFSSEQRAATISDYGYDMPIAEYDQQVAADQRQAGYTSVDPADTAAMGGAHLLRLREEYRVAQMYADASNYGGTTTLATATDRWDDPTSRPKELIDELAEGMIVSPTHLIINKPTYNKLTVHPNLVESVRGTGAREGRLNQNQLSEILDINVVVGMAKQAINFTGRVDPEAAVTTFSASRIWGNFAALVRLDSTVQTTVGSPMPTFCYAATYGNDIAGQIANDPFMGLDGGRWLRVGNRRKELVVSKFAGHLIQNVITAPGNITVDQSLPDGIIQLARGSF